MKKKITFPKKEKESVYIQGRIPRSLYGLLRAEMDRLDVSWDRLMKALIERFVEEQREEREEGKSARVPARESQEKRKSVPVPRP